MSIMHTYINACIQVCIHAYVSCVHTAWSASSADSPDNCATDTCGAYCISGVARMGQAGMKINVSANDWMRTQQEGCNGKL